MGGVGFVLGVFLCFLFIFFFLGRGGVFSKGVYRFRKKIRIKQFRCFLQE